MSRRSFYCGYSGAAMLLLATLSVGLQVQASVLRPSFATPNHKQKVNPKASSDDAEIKYTTKFVDDLTFTMHDNVTLHGDGFIPLRPEGDTTTMFPVIVYPNSWGMPQVEYILKTLQFADYGYVAVEYETRGWYLSGGEIDTAGPLDIQDASTVLTQILQRSDEWHINTSAVCFCGISYGAGISLAMAGTDHRVTTSVVLSGWNNITDALYPYHTPNLLWGGLLVLLADVVGHPNASLAVLFDDLVKHQNIEHVVEFAEKRSPGRFLDVMNRRNVPLFFNSNFLDRLFQPERMLDFFKQLTTPKMILLNQGMHAEAEGIGLFDIGNPFIWDKVKKWLDHFLKGSNNGITSEPQVQMQLGGNMLLDQDRVNFATWPASPAESETLKYFFTPRQTNSIFEHYGTLTTSKPHVNSSVIDDITYSEDPTVGSGFPLLGDLVSTLGIPVTDDLALTNKETSLIFMLPFDSVSNSDMTICGTPKVNLTLEVPVTENWQITGYIYEVDDLGLGELLSDTCYTNYADGNGYLPSQQEGPAAQRGRDSSSSSPMTEVRAAVQKSKDNRKMQHESRKQRQQQYKNATTSAGGNMKKLRSQKKESSSSSSTNAERRKVGTTQRIHLTDIMFHSFCRKIEKGKRLAVGFALYSSLYQPANTRSGWRLSFHYDDDEFPSSVEFPHVL